jgi:hypothetical protein
MVGKYFHLEREFVASKSYLKEMLKVVLQEKKHIIDQKLVSK